jgi:hypothetical protein
MLLERENRGNIMAVRTIMNAELRRKEIWPIVRNYSRICLWVMRKTMKANPDQNLNQVSSTNKTHIKWRHHRKKKKQK